MCPLQRLPHKPKHSENAINERSTYRVFTSSVIAVFVCVICLCGTSWAWFTANASTEVTAIKTSTYKLVYQVDSSTEVTEIASTGATYTLTADTCAITLKASGTSGATGYCSVQVEGQTYYTEQISADSTFTFTVNAALGTAITFIPNWGTYSGTATIENGGTITASNSQLSNTQAAENSVAYTPEAEPTALAENEAAVEESSIQVQPL